jgi:hypothetical protein
LSKFKLKYEGRKRAWKELAELFKAKFGFIVNNVHVKDITATSKLNYIDE